MLILVYARMLISMQVRKDMEQEISKEDFYKQGEELFGKDFKNWAFCCSSCGFKQSQASIVEIMRKDGFHLSKRYGKITLANIQELKPRIESECLAPECDYAAYGLIPSTFCTYGGMQVGNSFVFKFAVEVKS